jgi:adenylate cyclase
VDDRAELVEWLLGEGFTREEIDNSIAPIYLPAARIVGDDGTRLTPDEAAARSGMPLDLLIEFARAAGVPAVEDLSARGQVAADVDVAARAKEFLELGLPKEQVLAVTRVLAHGLSQAAEVMRQSALEAVLQPGASEVQLAQAYGAIVEVLAPKLGPMVHDLLLVQLRHTFETEAINASERAAGRLPGARDVGVAFADIVGFTRLGETLEPGELEEVARQLADRTRSLSQPPVRFIKTIGDAVMLISPDVDALVRVMLALSDEQLRIGIAYGPAVSRAGDWFGAPVNLASRVTAAARPGSVLVTEIVHKQLAGHDDITWSFAGPRRLKNVRDEVKLFRARPGGQRREVPRV